MPNLPSVTPDLVEATVTIWRQDEFYWLLFPSVCVTPSGRLVCCFTFSKDGHGPAWATLIRYSDDDGQTWHGRPIQVSNIDDGDSPGGGHWIECLDDGSLLIAFDAYSNDFPDTNSPTRRTRVWLYRSVDNGISWNGPETTDCQCVSPTLLQLSNGVLIMSGSHEHRAYGIDDLRYWSQVVYRSFDRGLSWEGPITVLHDPNNYSVAEGHGIETDGRIVMWVRTPQPENGTVPSPHPRLASRATVGAMKMISDDGGTSWRGPFASGGPFLIEGRVAAGQLQSGESLILHRLGDARSGEYQRLFGFFVESHDSTIAETEYQPSVFAPTALSWGVIDYCPDSVVPPTREARYNGDTGYGDWVQLASGDVFAVNYVNDLDGHYVIRGYRLSLRKLLEPSR